MGNVNSNWINLVFVIDASGSMYQSKEDVTGGFAKIINEQKANKDGKVTVSLYTFNSDVTEHYVGKDINEIPEFKYNPDGMTRLNDGCGIAIDNVGKWLYERDKNGEEMPQQTLVVVMTDGLENSSREYTLEQVKNKITEQTEKYGWQFIYQGVDITTTKMAEDLGFKWKNYSSRKNMGNNYDVVNAVTTCYRKLASTGIDAETLSTAFCASLNEETTGATLAFENEIGKKLTSD
jgi:uncharacterized protein YegL